MAARIRSYLKKAQPAGRADRSRIEAMVREMLSRIETERDDAAIASSEADAPEHLEVQTPRNDDDLERPRNDGSLLLCEESTVSYGDKRVCTNHALPTGRAARSTGGLWVEKFLESETYQRLTPEASRAWAPTIARICEAERMAAHAITRDERFNGYAPRNAASDVGLLENAR